MSISILSVFKPFILISAIRTLILDRKSKLVYNLKDAFFEKAENIVILCWFYNKTCMSLED
jgi:hypothetical protein